MPCIEEQGHDEQTNDLSASMRLGLQFCVVQWSALLSFLCVCVCVTTKQPREVLVVYEHKTLSFENEEQPNNNNNDSKKRTVKTQQQVLYRYSIHGQNKTE